MDKRTFLYEERKACFEALFPHLNYEFVQAMDDIGRHGLEKHKDESFQAKVKAGNVVRTERLSSSHIGIHAADHYHMAVRGEKHDYFGTVLHNFAAASFNPYMEAVLSGAINDTVRISEGSVPDGTRTS